jgi:vancomycin resistance protein YoaR
MLDLEKVAERAAVDRSYDLRLALDTKRIRLCSQGVVSKSAKPEVRIVEKVVEKHHHHETETQVLDEAKLAALMRKIMLENKVDAPQPVQSDSNQQILDAMNALNNKIESMGGSGTNDSISDMPAIDPEKLAELQSKAIAKLSDSIQTGIKKTGKKVILKNTKLGDLASELGE